MNANVAVSTEENVAVSNVVVEKRKAGRPAGQPNTKLAQCKVLFAKMKAEGKSRQEILTAFVDKIGTSVGSAQVYYHNAKHAFDATVAG